LEASPAVETLVSFASDELPVGTPVGEYRIEGKIATGGMGTIYAAIHPVIGKRAAVKVISWELSQSPDAVERFWFEARSVNEIGHPNIVDIFGFGTLPDGRVYLIMEWLVGETLATRCQFELLTIRESAHIVRTVARTLQTVHESGFIHRDLKPDNVFLVSRRSETRIAWPYEVKLLDFGIAKLAAGDESSMLTGAGVVVGTPRYLSPEQARGERVDAATDIYSLGVVAYELLAGDVPFVADNPAELMAMHVHQPPAPMRSIRPEMPPALDALVLAMLAKDPRERPGLAECRRRLDAALDPDVTQMLPARPVPTPRPQAAPVFTPPPGQFSGPTPRIGLVMAFGALVVLIAVVVGAALLQDRPAIAEPAVDPPAPTASAMPPRPAGVAPAEPEAAPPDSRRDPPHRRRARRAETTHRPVPLR
jgi:serine/threonine-protein kinase